ncbi:hypothetical protein PRIPAC_82534 [Pristionchus pacificus]|uniref:G protein-coupled receptor n=1 Tax=Pristionchus pacificus TaxID=54126 RepID=A0A2A6CPA0_PRIPA|nr:hypothetical protein PRIPAC_78077 [Pristionchus pacificus]KAF8376105.1 hypothetical protein PRIPAC_82534 [Pristionchus pacificus]|eukprot:PDM79924.1 G protein-coupled receptor [Pristionchus pacificus]
MTGIVIYQLAISTAVGAVGAISDASWIRDSEGGVYPQHRISELEKMMFSGLLSFSILFIMIISTAYIVAYFKLRSRLKAIKIQIVKNKSERLLTYVAILTCAVEVFYYSVFAYVFLIAKHVESDPRTFHFILAIQGNLASGIHPYLLFIFSDLARNAVGRYLFDLFNCSKRVNSKTMATPDSNVSW